MLSQQPSEIAVVAIVTSYVEPSFYQGAKVARSHTSTEHAQRARVCGDGDRG
jgi:hypothetical protein